MKKKIFIADLTHTARGIHASTFPLGTAYVASFAQEALGEDFEIKLFKFPEELSQRIVDDHPVVLALSNYSWNLQLGYKLSCWAKKQYPDLIVVFGGPNFPIVASEKNRFLKQHSAVDFYIQNEGEIGFVELIKKLQMYDLNVKKFKDNKELVANCAYLDGEEFIESPPQQIKDLSILPSPYLSGILDEFFKFPLVPMIETTRGCPFSCIYCSDGNIAKSKIRRFKPERTRDEINYIRERIKNIDEIIITDLNFGMYDEDVVTARYIAENQNKYNWPVLVQGSAGKNNSKRIMEVASILNGSWVVGSAIQSSDKEVLKNIKRSNVSLETYREFLKFYNSLFKDVITYTEVILALPGDTKIKHFESLRYGIDNGANTVRMYQTMLLIGTEMSTQKTREEYGLLTKFRVIPNGVGIYQFGADAVPVAEIEEIVIGGKYMTFKDYVSCRVMNLFVETYVNNALFEEIFSALKIMGVSVFDCLVYLHGHEELYTPKMKEIIESFIKSTRDDLYDSYEEAEAYVLSPKIIKKHISGELGINELLVHKMQLYLELEDITGVLLKALKNYLAEKGLLNINVERYLEQLGEFIICRKSDIHKYDVEVKHLFNYDFEAIDRVGYKIDPRDIKESTQQVRIKFFHDEMQKKHIQNCLKIYASPYIGISRMIQRSNLKKIYRCFEPVL
jgi:hypothetical protein